MVPCTAPTCQRTAGLVPHRRRQRQHHDLPVQAGVGRCAHRVPDLLLSGVVDRRDKRVRQRHERQAHVGGQQVHGGRDRRSERPLALGGADPDQVEPLQFVERNHQPADRPVDQQRLTEVDVQLQRLRDDQLGQRHLRLIVRGPGDDRLDAQRAAGPRRVDHHDAAAGGHERRRRKLVAPPDQPLHIHRPGAGELPAGVVRRGVKNRSSCPTRPASGRCDPSSGRSAPIASRRTIARPAR